MLALETFGRLDGERLAVAIRARRTINRDFKLRARCLLRSAFHRHLPLPQSSSASRFTAGASGFFILSQSGERRSIWIWDGCREDLGTLWALWGASAWGFAFLPGLLMGHPDGLFADPPLPVLSWPCRCARQLGGRSGRAALR